MNRLRGAWRQYWVALRAMIVLTVALGIGYLADVWMLEREGGTPLRVRMLEVTPARIVVKVDDYGDVSRATERFTLPWPIPAGLRAPRAGDPDGFTRER